MILKNVKQSIQKDTQKMERAFRQVDVLQEMSNINKEEDSLFD